MRIFDIVLTPLALCMRSEGGYVNAAKNPGLYSTGVPRLDDVLGGGLPSGSLALIMGPPGSGKTTLANQMAFSAARAGRKAIVFTALSEPTGKLIEHLRNFQFFDSDLIGDQLQFLNLQQFLASGLPATAEELIAAARAVQAEFVTLDGFRGVRGAEATPQQARQFLYDIGATLSLHGTTTLITSEANPRDPAFYPETTTADVIIGLYYSLIGVRERRGIEITKMRGVSPMLGMHGFVLDQTGLTVYPRVEAQAISERIRDGVSSGTPFAKQKEEQVEEATPPAGFGLAELDTLLGGGLTRQTAMLLEGSMGAGKTLLAVQFALAGVQNNEPTVFLSFREHADQLLRMADAFSFGARLREALATDDGLLKVAHWLPVELDPDQMTVSLLDLIDRIGARRLVIDSVAELVRCVVESSDSGSGRVPNYLVALLSVLRARRVTTLFVKELRPTLTATPYSSGVARENDSPDHIDGLDWTGGPDPLATHVENVIRIQQTFANERRRRTIAIVKTRFTTHDERPREFVISPPEGLIVLPGASFQ